jgi:ABC-type antimicrobial peptide transport system permease subunit
MKPLSPILYSIRNKKKIFASINSVMLAVLFLYVLYTFSKTLMEMQRRNHLPIYKNLVSVMSYNQNPIDKKLIKSITSNENVERIIPTIFNYGIRYSILGAADSSIALPIRIADRDYFMKRQGIRLILGELPREGLKEIAINKDIAKNRNIKLGCKVGDSVNKFDDLPGEYVVVGLLESEALISILSVNENIYPNYKDKDYIMGISFYVFPKEGKKAALDKFISSFPKDKVTVTTEAGAFKHFERVSGALKVIDIIAILAIIVMVITVGSSKYVQYINRKEELGLLNAIGYNKNQILGKTLKEVVSINVFGFLLGILLGAIASLGLDKGLWSPRGVTGLLYSSKGFIIAMFVPLFTILFSIIPINSLINKLDPIKMIEKY